MNKIITLLKNIKYLMNHSLNEEKKDIIYNTLIRLDDYYKYEILDDMEYINNMPVLDVYNYDETINLLLNKPKSFCRFGDGEIELIEGKGIPFQEYNEVLGRRLKNILHTYYRDMYVGINYNYFHNTRNMNELNRKFYLYDVKVYREKLLKYCNPTTKYIAAGFNQLYMVMQKFDYDNYYDKIKSVFKDKELVVFCGVGILEKHEYNVFENCDSIEYVSFPNKNAFACYSEILNKARTYSKNKILCFILGPTSKILVEDLTKEGYMAWDIGHMAKDYDVYMRKVAKTQDEIGKFFMPD